MFKEILYTGLGVSSLIKDKIEDEISKLDKDGKIDTKDLKSFVNSLESKGEQEEEKLKKKIKEMVREALDEVGVVTKEDLSKLKEELKAQK
jgi:polyhydroxyalkanoate synthesis regulator phasin